MSSEQLTKTPNNLEKLYGIEMKLLKSASSILIIAKSLTSLIFMF